MKIPRCYIPQPLKPGHTYDLPTETAHHLTHVLRLRPEQELVIFNGQGGEFEGHLTHVAKKRVQVTVDGYRDVKRESSLLLTLAQGVSRGQKMDYTIQKSVELGIRRIVPILNERSSIRLADERRDRKHEHWRKIIISACEQCGRNELPELDPAVSLEEWINNDSNVVKLVLVPQASRRFTNINVNGDSMTLLIGSEGGLNAGEIALSEKAGYTPVSLGPRVLRTETAAVAALAVCQSLWGDL